MELIKRYNKLVFKILLFQIQRVVPLYTYAASECTPVPHNGKVTATYGRTRAEALLSLPAPGKIDSFHFISPRYVILKLNHVQMMTASVVHVTNLTPPGSGGNHFTLFCSQNTFS